MMEPRDDSILPYLEDSPPQNSKSGGIFRPIVVEEDEVMLEMARNLSFEQRIVFDQMVKFCKSILRSMMGATNVIQLPPRLIVTGKLLSYLRLIIHFFYSYYVKNLLSSRWWRCWQNLFDQNCLKMD